MSTAVTSFISTFLAPFAWLLQFQIKYSLVPWVCATGAKFVLPLTGFTGLLLALGGIMASFHLLKLQHATDPSAGENSSSLIFLARLNMLLGALFALLIVAQIIPDFVIDPCKF